MSAASSVPEPVSEQPGSASEVVRVSSTAGVTIPGPARGEWIVAILLAAGLAAIVWRPLLTGGGLVGGDIYPYFFPQKQAVAEAFANGEFPSWQDRTSLGYPLHAESQAGVLYPPNQLLYRLLPVHAAYHASQLLHYMLAFVFAWRFARSQQVSHAGSLLVAGVYVYGWFPARVSLEWSIIGGVWFPLCLWLTERLRERPSRPRFAALAIAIALHLLAGHFALAFITQLTCLLYALLRREYAVARDQGPKPAARRLEWQTAGLVIAALMTGFLLSAVQLAPTLELQRLSQRSGSEGRTFDPAYGHMPPVYLTQLVASWWFWHTADIVQTGRIHSIPFLRSPAGTNHVEAHLYVGLIPFALLGLLLSFRTRQRLRGRPWMLWLGLSLAAIVYSFGWFVPLTKHLPGFGWFMGPGRFTIVAALGLPMVAMFALEAALRKWQPRVRISLVGVIAVISVVDVLQSTQPPVRDAVVVNDPPLNALPDSGVAKILQTADKQAPMRLVCAGANIGNLFGVSSVPQYLGLGPAEYFQPESQVLPQPDGPGPFPSAEQHTRWQSLGVTHLLTSEAVAELHPEWELVASEPDAFLNRVWARGTRPCWLYRMRTPEGRLMTKPASALSSASFDQRRSSDVLLTVSLKNDAVVTLRELMYPGWTVEVDDRPDEPLTSRGFGRQVKVPAGTHTIRWHYQPVSLTIGLMISGSAIVLLAVFVCVRLKTR